MLFKEPFKFVKASQTLVAINRLIQLGLVNYTLLSGFCILEAGYQLVPNAWNCVPPPTAYAGQ